MTVCSCSCLALCVEVEGFARRDTWQRVLCAVMRMDGYCDIFQTKQCALFMFRVSAVVESG